MSLGWHRKIKELVFHVVQCFFNELPIDLVTIITLNDWNSVGKVMLLEILLARILLQSICSLLTINIFNNCIVTSLQQIKLGHEQMMGEREFTFKNSLDHFMVRTVEIVKDPRMEELEFEQSHLHLRLFLTFHFLPLHVFEQ
jgi:hypothetical protein